jgi:hypothetical protein
MQDRQQAFASGSHDVFCPHFALAGGRNFGTRHFGAD